ncbi:hypothetical protein [Empedobacter brevis]|uniref:hypothetical protein n=1 Tax=Empedobacter brevis TaxID=247 RepID=UPI0039B027E5
MKKINFQHTGSRTNLIIILLLGFCVTITFLIVCDYLILGNIFIQKLFPILTYSFLAIYAYKFYWYKNVFQWNKNSFSSRINNFWGINKKFKDIDKVDFNKNKIVILDKYGACDIINLENINSESKAKLLEIFKSKLK